MPTVLITGAANGLGKATADEFTRKGWDVVATDIAVPETPFQPGPGRCLFLEMDVRSDDAVNAAYHAIARDVDWIDLIINNAGIDRYFPLSETSVSEFRNIFEVNLFGCYRVNSTFLPLLRKPGGRIIHIGSESGWLKVPFMPYPLTKNALERYAMVLRQELRFSGIDVVIIRPGAIGTAILDNVARLPELEIGGSLEKPFRRFVTQAPKEIGKVITPGKAARFICKVALVKDPKPVYRINNSVLLRLASSIPFCLMERLIRKKLSG
jgi:NAD(P)-dependent dehydrogenase (short-subunit alcohol dehydrogenase family)